MTSPKQPHPATDGYVPPYWQRKLPLHWIRWLTRPLSCKLGRHTFDSQSWGFGGSVIDWYCLRCQDRIGETALDDADGDMMERISAAMERLGIQGIEVSDDQS